MTYKDRLVALNWPSNISFAVLSSMSKCLFGLVNCDMCIAVVVIAVCYTDTITFQHLQARTQALQLSCLHQFPCLKSNLPQHGCNFVISQGPLDSLFVLDGHNYSFFFHL